MDKYVCLHAKYKIGTTICPFADIHQWMEDARPRAMIAAAWFNDTSLRRIMVRQQAEMQQPDGTMHPFPPYGCVLVYDKKWPSE
jgi:hypothetical protein